MRALALVSLPHALRFLGSVGGPTLQQIYDPNKYVGLVTALMAVFGITFEFPVDPRRPGARRGGEPGEAGVVASVGHRRDRDRRRRSSPRAGTPSRCWRWRVPLYVFYEVSIVIGQGARRAARRPGRRTLASVQATFGGDEPTRPASAAAECGRQEALRRLAGFDAPATAASSSSRVILERPGMPSSVARACSSDLLERRCPPTTVAAIRRCAWSGRRAGALLGAAGDGDVRTGPVRPRRLHARLQRLHEVDDLGGLRLGDVR